MQQNMNHSSPKVTEIYIRGIEGTSEKAATIMSDVTFKKLTRQN